MASGQIIIDSEAVGAAVNQIDVAIADINTRNEKFIQLLTEKNKATHGKFGLLETLQKRVEEEATNIKDTVAATEEIKSALRKYEEQAEEANDDSAFRV